MGNLRTLAAAATLIAAAPAHAVFIDFDDGTDNVAVDAFYAGLGVTFSNTQWTSNFGLDGTSGPLGISAIAGAGGEFQPDVTTPLVATFSSLVSSVSIVAIDVGEHGARIDAYDAMDNLVAFDEAFGPDVGVGFFFTLSAAGGIARIELYQPRWDLAAGDGVLWEDLEFELAVPEPGVLWLMAGGLLALGARRRT